MHKILNSKNKKQRIAIFYEQQKSLSVCFYFKMREQCVEKVFLFAKKMHFFLFATEFQ